MTQAARQDGFAPVAASKPPVRVRWLSGHLLSGSATYLLSNLVTAAVPFALLPVLTRYMQPAEYGEVAMFQTLTAAMSAFVGLNVAGAAARKFFDSLQADEERQYLAACLQILVVTSLIALAVLLAFRHPLQKALGLAASWILLAVPMSAMSMMMQLRLTQWQVRKQSWSYAALQVFQSVINAGLSLLFVATFALGAAGRMSAQLAAMTLTCVVSILTLRRDGLLGFFSWRPAYVREVLHFGVPLIPHVTGIFLIAAVDRFVVNAQLGPAVAGIYMVAVQLGAAVGLLFDAFNNAYVPWLFERLKRNTADENRRVVRSTYAWLGTILLIGAVAFVVGPPLVRLVAGSRYAAASEIIGWIALGHCCGGMYVMFANYMFYAKRTAVLSMTTVTCGLVNVMLLVWLTRDYGVAGAAMSFTGAMAVRFALTWAAAQRCHPMPWLRPCRES